MNINWLKNSELSGTATINKNNIVLNKTFINRFEKVQNCLVGVSDTSKTIVVKPLTLDELDNPIYKDKLIVKVSTFKNFLRIGNSKCVSLLISYLEIDLNKEAIKFKTSWDEEGNQLLIDASAKLN